MRNTKQNWLQKAFDHTAKGEIAEKVEEIVKACSTSLPSFYRWKKTGFVPRECDRVKICEILNWDMKTNSPLTPQHA